VVDKMQFGKTQNLLVAKLAESPLKTATFSLGWFWTPEGLYGCVPGVIRTRVGYTGGTKANPTYYSLGDHTETVQIDFDPSVVSYSELLDIFWKQGGLSCKSSSSNYRQYMSAVFYHDEEQKEEATKSRDNRQTTIKATITTPILQAEDFYIAEDYHQKYLLQQQANLTKSFVKSPFQPFVDSTPATRMNGFLSGHGTLSNLMKEVDSYGLPTPIRDDLIRIVKDRSRI